MALPRWVHQAYANANGYFWLPCLFCGREWGGHEWDHGGGIEQRDGLRAGVCVDCSDYASWLNEKRRPSANPGES